MDHKKLKLKALWGVLRQKNLKRPIGVSYQWSIDKIINFDNKLNKFWNFESLTFVILKL